MGKIIIECDKEDQIYFINMIMNHCDYCPLEKIFKNPTMINRAFYCDNSMNCIDCLNKRIEWRITND